MYVIINKINHIINVYTEEHNSQRYFALVRTDKSKGTLKKYEELRKKIKEHIRSININSDDYEEKHMKIKFNSEELHDKIIVVSSFFMRATNAIHKNFLDKCL